MRYFALTSILISRILWADGGFIPPSGGLEVYSADQIAIIRVLPDSEELMILAQAWSDALVPGFAWMVPLPSQPEIAEVDAQLFVDIANLAAPIYEGAGCSGPFFGGFGRGNSSEGDNYIEITDYDTIGFLQYVVIHTNNPDTLETWLVTHGYDFPPGINALLDHYITQKWLFFFIAEVDSAALDPYELRQHVGISFTFATPELVYPMEITSLSALDNTDLILYTICDHKMFFDRATLKYANRISPDELAAVKTDFPTLATYLTTGCYITKLKCVYKSPVDMDDITLFQAADDIEYRSYYDPSSYYGNILNSMIAPLVLYLLLLGCWRIARKRHTGRDKRKMPI